MNIDTTTATGTLMVNIFASVAQFERDQMLLRQRVGIEAAKLADKSKPLEERSYRGAKPTARAKADSVRTLLASGYSKERIARELEIGIASVYRILKTATQIDISFKKLLHIKHKFIAVIDSCLPWDIFILSLGTVQTDRSDCAI